jgi:hypothetical protein
MLTVAMEGDGMEGAEDHLDYVTKLEGDVILATRAIIGDDRGPNVGR